MNALAYRPVEEAPDLRAATALFHITRLQLAPEGWLEVVCATTKNTVELVGDSTYCMFCEARLDEQGEGHMLDCTTLRARRIVNELPILLARYRAARESGADIDTAYRCPVPPADVHAAGTEEPVQQQDNRPSFPRRVDLTVTAAVGQIALLGFLAFMVLAGAARRGGRLLRAWKKELILLTGGAVIGAVGMAVAGVAMMLGQSPWDAALTLAALTFSHGTTFKA